MPRRETNDREQPVQKLDEFAYVRALSEKPTDEFARARASSDGTIDEFARVRASSDGAIDEFARVRASSDGTIDEIARVSVQSARKNFTKTDVRAPADGTTCKKLCNTLKDKSEAQIRIVWKTRR